MKITEQIFYAGNDSYRVSVMTGEKLQPEAALVIVIGEGSTPEDMAKKYALDDAILKGEIVAVFPQIEGKWKYGDGELTDHEHLVVSLLRQGNLWGNMRIAYDMHYIIAEKSGADLALSSVMKKPGVACAAAVCLVQCNLEIPINAKVFSLPGMLVNCSKSVEKWFIRGNCADVETEKRCFCMKNQAQAVHIINSENEGIFPWKNLFSNVRRINITPEGMPVIRHRLPENALKVENEKLSDGLNHAWLEVPPEKYESYEKMPLMIVSHGMGGIPEDCARQTEMHRIGMKEGFLTVYPLASNGIRWNLNQTDDLPDDMAYYIALIDRLCQKYPIDRTRIYTSGFSNGAGMAMEFALTHPEIVAATCPIDSTFPYASTAFFTPVYEDEWLRTGEEHQPVPLPESNYDVVMAPLEAALEKQKNREKKLIVPIMYFYGTRESEYPIRNGSNQQLAFDFWLKFNEISPKSAEMLCEGCPAQEGETVKQSEITAEAPYKCTERVFYTEDGVDAYHFVLCNGKAHDVHPVEASMGWNFVKNFRREV